MGSRELKTIFHKRMQMLGWKSQGQHANKPADDAENMERLCVLMWIHMCLTWTCCVPSPLAARDSQGYLSPIVGEKDKELRMACKRLCIVLPIDRIEDRIASFLKTMRKSLYYALWH